MSSNNFDPDLFVKDTQFTANYHRDVYPALDPSKPEHSLAGKISVITGAGRGIGRPTALIHARAGVKALALVGRSVRHLDDVKAELNRDFPSVEVLVCPGDVTQPDAVTLLFDKILDTFGPPDILINNAGVLAEGLLRDRPNEWWSNIEVNFKGAFLVVASFLRITKGKATTIVHTGTHPAWEHPTTGGYFVSKVALTEMSERIDFEYPEVMSYTVHPGMISTDMQLPENEPYAKDTPELFGAYTVWLASQRPEYLSGRWMSDSWDIGQLAALKDEIVDKNLLRYAVRGNIGTVYKA